MAKELKDVTVTHISLVKNGANNKKFFLTKSADGKTQFQMISKKVIVNKEETEKKLVYCVVYEPNTIDLQKDFMTEETIEKMAHTFLKDYRNIDVDHSYVAGEGSPVESYIAPVDMEVCGEEIKKGSWVACLELTEEAWELVKKGELESVSIGGYAENSEIVPDEAVSKSVFGILKSFVEKFGGKIPVEKTFKETFINMMNNDPYLVMDAFREAVWDDYWNTPSNEQFKEKFLQSIKEMYEHVSGMTFKVIEKSQSNKEDLGMTEEERKRLEELAESINKMTARIEEISKSIAESKVENETKIEVIGKSIDLLTGSLENVSSFIEAVEKNNEAERVSSVGGFGLFNKKEDNK